MSLSAAVSLDDSICPNCGTSPVLLNAVSGFCVPCTKQRFPNKAVCDLCGRIEERGQFRSICQSCEYERWLAKNADRIEAYMLVGLTFRMAVVFIRRSNLPICLSCGYKIKGGTKGRHFFCRTTQQCKSAGIKYHHYLHRHGKSKEEALSLTLEWLNDRRRNEERSESVIAASNS